MKTLLLSVLLLFASQAYGQRIDVGSINRVAYYKVVDQLEAMDSVLQANYFTRERVQDPTMVGEYYTNTFNDVVAVDADSPANSLNVSVLTRDLEYFTVLRESVRQTYPLQGRGTKADQTFEIYTCENGVLQVGRYDMNTFYVTRIVVLK